MQAEHPGDICALQLFPTQALGLRSGSYGRSQPGEGPPTWQLEVLSLSQQGLQQGDVISGEVQMLVSAADSPQVLQNPVKQLQATQRFLLGDERQFCQRQLCCSQRVTCKGPGDSALRLKQWAAALQCTRGARPAGSATCHDYRDRGSHVAQG